MKSPHDEMEAQRKALMEQEWAKKVLAAPKAGPAQEESYLPVETLIKAAKASGKDDASITTINTRNRRGGGRATTAFGRGNYKGDEGAPTLMLCKEVCAGEATAQSTTGGRMARFLPGSRSAQERTKAQAGPKEERQCSNWSATARMASRARYCGAPSA